MFFNLQVFQNFYSNPKRASEIRLLINKIRKSSRFVALVIFFTMETRIIKVILILLFIIFYGYLFRLK